MRCVFENDVEMYGAQTQKKIYIISASFENDVEMYGAQTGGMVCNILVLFENDVEMYGAQTDVTNPTSHKSLRMM